MVHIQLSESDEGKRVVDKHGTEIGVVSGIRNGSAYVDPDPGITDSILARIGWEHIDEDDYKLDPSDIDAVHDDEIKLNR